MQLLTSAGKHAYRWQARENMQTWGNRRGKTYFLWWQEQINLQLPSIAGKHPLVAKRGKTGNADKRGKTYLQVASAGKYVKCNKLEKACFLWWALLNVQLPTIAAKHTTAVKLGKACRCLQGVRTNVASVWCGSKCNQCHTRENVINAARKFTQPNQDWI